MGKRSKKKRAKQKELLRQSNFIQPSLEKPLREDSLAQQKKFYSYGFKDKFKDKNFLRKLKKISIYMVVSSVVLWGLFGLYKLATRPLPGTPVADLGNEHIPSAQTPHSAYNSKPPTSGSHLDPKARWGIHDQQISDELQLHNLEDGGVVISYDCDGEDCTVLVEQLKQIASKYKDRVILAPYAGLDTRITLTAWNRIDAFDEFDEKRVTSFISTFRGIDHHKK